MMAVITAAGPKQVVQMQGPDGTVTRVLVVHDAGNMYQVPFDPIEAAVIARDLSPSAHAAAEAVEQALAARGITPDGPPSDQRPSGLHVVGDVPAPPQAATDATSDDPAMD